MALKRSAPLRTASNRSIACSRVFLSRSHSSSAGCERMRARLGARAASADFAARVEEKSSYPQPPVGTAYLLACRGTLFGKETTDIMRFEEGAGLVEVKLLRDGTVIVGASIRAPRDLEIGKIVDADVIASCISLRPQEIITAHHKPV